MSTLSDGHPDGPPSTVNGGAVSGAETTSAVEPVIMRQSKRLSVPASVVEARRGSLQMDVLRSAGRRELGTAVGLRGLIVPSSSGVASTGGAVCADMPTIVGLKPTASAPQKPALLIGSSSNRRSSCYQSVLTSGPFGTSTIPLTVPPPSAQLRRSSISGYPVVGAHRSGGLLAAAVAGGGRLGALPTTSDGPAVEGRLDDDCSRRPTATPQQKICRLPTIESESPVVVNKHHSADRSNISNIDETTMTSTSVVFDVHQTSPPPPPPDAATDDIDAENTDAGLSIVVSPPPPPPSPSGPSTEIQDGFPVADDVTCNGIEPALTDNRKQFKQPTADDEEDEPQTMSKSDGDELATTSCRISCGDLVTSSEEGVTTNWTVDVDVGNDVTEDVSCDADTEQKASQSLSTTAAQPTTDTNSALFNIVDVESVTDGNAADEDSDDTPPEIPAFYIDVKAAGDATGRRLDSEDVDEAVSVLNSVPPGNTNGSPFSNALRSDDVEERSSLSDAETVEHHPEQLGVNGSQNRERQGTASTTGTSSKPNGTDVSSPGSRSYGCENGDMTTRTGGISDDVESKENVDAKTRGGVNGENRETNSSRVKSINQVNDDDDSSGSISIVNKTPGKDEHGRRDADGSMEVVIAKGNLGLGFCISGGSGSAMGDLPIIVKRIFKGETPVHGFLVQGDEILTANGLDFTAMSHHEAWNTLKSLPDGPVTLVVRRK